MASCPKNACISCYKIEPPEFYTQKKMTTVRVAIFACLIGNFEARNRLQKQKFARIWGEI
jgi:hypothetical protein